MSLYKASPPQLCLVVSAVLALSNTAMAANTPCSGSKGGIAGCDGDLLQRWVYQWLKEKAALPILAPFVSV
jgi:hypothetical protein